MSAARPKRPLAGPGLYALIIGISLLVGLGTGIAGGFAGDIPGTPGLLLSLLINCAAMAVGMAACVWWWRRLDEAAREAHKWAWWWGGCTGMAVGGAILLTVIRREDSSDLASVTLSSGFAAGIGIMMACQILGYAIGWIVWWARRR